MQKENDKNLDRINWNDWRKNYNQLSFEDQQKAYAEAEKWYPNQTHFTTPLIQWIVEYCKNHSDQSFRVVEIGGWKGELAKEILEQCPNISYWENIELLESCRTKSKCTDPRYYVNIPSDFFWNQAPIEGFDIFVASNTLEHFNRKEIQAICDCIQKISVIFMETPHGNWNNYKGYHILDMTRKELNQQIIDTGFTLLKEEKDVRVFQQDWFAKLNHDRWQVWETMKEHPMTILVIGWFVKDKYGTGIAKELEARGHTVYRVSLDWQPHSVIDPKVNLFVYEEEPRDCIDGHKRIKLKKYVDLYPEIDCMFLGQTNTLYFDMNGIYVPTYYYQKEIGYPFYPTNAKAIVGMFYAYCGAVGKMFWLHKPEFMKQSFQTLVPYGVDTSIFVREEVERDIPLGFMGSWEWNTDHPELADPQMIDIYQLRKRFLFHARDHHGAILNSRDYSADPLTAWIKWMSRVDIAINIPGNWGKLNERQFYVLSLGCILLQWKFPELQELGFYDKYNCLTFADEKEMDQKLQWLANHPEEKEAIRQRGIMLAQQHTWKYRTLQILEQIVPINEAHKKRLAWLKKYESSKWRQLP